MLLSHTRIFDENNTVASALSYPHIFSTLTTQAGSFLVRGAFCPQEVSVTTFLVVLSLSSLETQWTYSHYR